MRIDRIRAALAGVTLLVIVVMSPVPLGASAPDSTEPPAEEPPAEGSAPEEPVPEEPGPEEPAETQPVDGEEAPPEPADVSVAVWVGVVLLVVVAIIWAVRQSATSSSSHEP